MRKPYRVEVLVKYACVCYGKFPIPLRPTLRLQDEPAGCNEHPLINLWKIMSSSIGVLVVHGMMVTPQNDSHTGKAIRHHRPCAHLYMLLLYLLRVLYCSLCVTCRCAEDTAWVPCASGLQRRMEPVGSGGSFVWGAATTHIPLSLGGVIGPTSAVAAAHEAALLCGSCAEHAVSSSVVEIHKGTQDLTLRHV